MPKTEREAEQAFMGHLDDVYGDRVDICGIEYSTSRALKEISPTDFDVMFGDWSDAEGIEIE